MKLLRFLFLISTVSCFQSKKDVHPENSLSFEDIEFIVLTNEFNSPDSSYNLNEEEIKFFINEWNNSQKEGHYKMITQYYIGILTKDFEERRFRINGELIKEKGDVTFSFMNPNFIKNLWKKAELIPPLPPLPPMFRECDSLSKLAKTDYKNGIRKHTTFGMVEATDFEQFHSKYMKENYNITTISSCVIDINKDCYNRAMNREIEKELGENFVDKTYEKAKIEFEKLKE